MRCGLYGSNMGACADPSVAARVAQVAETAGLDSLWAGEHVVLPDPFAPPAPLPPEAPILDPTVSFAYLAAATKRIRLCTGIIILPQRNPLVLAKELASLDVLSGGRLVFGIGIGYLDPEFAALGISTADKAARTEDYLAAMRAIWTMDHPAYAGRFVSFSGVRAMPRPVQRPHPPIVVGGVSAAACDRAARLGSGWYGFGLEVDAAAKCVTMLRAACRRHGRREDEVEVSVTPFVSGADPRLRPVVLSLAEVRAYAEAGVDRLILCPPWTAPEADVVAFVQQIGRELVGRGSAR